MHKQLLFIPLLALQLLAGSRATSAQATFAPDLHFVQNKGQITDQYGQPRKDLDYRLKVNSGFSVFIGNGLIQYQWCKGKAQPEAALPERYQLQHMDVQLLGANKNAPVIAEEKVQYYEQYHLSAVSTIANAYQKITYRDIYPHIDWIIYLKNNVAEYDFVLHPGAKAGDIKMQYRGALSLQQNADGSVTAKTASGQVTEQTPTAMQADGQKIASRFVLNGQTLSFRTASYTGTLTIDPVLQWATYLGGSLNEFAYQCTTDRSGNVYVAGSTASTSNIAATGAYQTTYGGGTGSATYVGDAYLAKFNASGARLWTTYYGGTGADQGWSVATDTANNVYLAGFTNSTAGISTVGAQQATLAGGNDAFLVKFDSSGTRLWGTYFGGTGNENVLTAVRCDRQGHVYLSGVTASANGIATVGAHQPTIGGSTDAFLAQYNNNGALQWATYYGGSGAENNFIQHATDAQGNVYLSGITSSAAGIASTGAAQSVYGGATDGFLAKFNASGVRQWGTYVGGSNYDRVHGLACGDSGQVFLAGATESLNAIATAGSYQQVPIGLSGIFIARYDSSGAKQWGSYFNGNANTASGVASICAAPNGGIYFSGYTNSDSIIATPGTYKDTITGGSDAILVKFTTGGQRVWATYFGGVLDENGRSVTCDQQGHIYLAGETMTGLNVATTGAYQTAYGGGYQDGFLARFEDCDTLGTPGPVTTPPSLCRNSTYTFSVPAITGATSYMWTLPAGWSGNSITSNILVTTGIDTGTIQVSAVSACRTGPALTLPLSFSVTASMNPSGTNAICAGNSLVLHAGIGNNYTYQWMKDGLTISGATDSTYTANASGKYSVAVQSGGCRDTAGIDTLIVHPLPVPLISSIGGVLSTGAYATYQWALNGSALTGAVNASFNPLVNGNYTVMVTDTNGCSGTSAPYAFSNVSVGALAVHGFRLYPNPVTDVLYVDGANKVKLQLLSVDGRLLRTSSVGSSLKVEGLAAGVYFVRVLDTDGLLLGVERVLKTGN